MELCRLEPGEHAPTNANRVRIMVTPDGKYAWAGALLVADAARYGLAAAEYASLAQAEKIAIEWAREQGADRVTIELDSGFGDAPTRSAQGRPRVIAHG